MFDFQRTSEERTGDSQRPFKFGRGKEHKDRVKAHIARIEREKEEMRTEDLDD